MDANGAQTQTSSCDCNSSPCADRQVACLPYRTPVYPIPVVPMKIDDTDPTEGARQLLKHVRPEWPSDRLRFTVFTDGYTNKLISCSVSSDEVILVRIYGYRTELLVDREQERNSMIILHTSGCAAPLYCRFDNGIVYGFQPGVVLDIDLARRPIVQRLIAAQMIKMQSVDVAAAARAFGNGLHFDTQPCLFPTLYKWLANVPSSYPNQQQQASVDRLPVRCEGLREEVDLINKVLPGMGSPVVFCHNDLLLKNIVYDEEHEKVSFIDFEYVGYNYEAFDIANHFCEYAGMAEVDFSLYPDREYQLGWLRTFLELRYAGEGRSSDEVSDTDVQRLYVQVNKFALAAHLFWALWALIQARFSHIDYDYIEFAHLRLEEYCARKAEFLSLQMP